MQDARFLKARCKKTGQYVGLEIWKFGSTWKVVNAVPLSSDEAKIVYSEIRQPRFETNSNLVPCTKCKSRVISGCSCEKRVHKCGSDNFNFQCVYCKELEIDYSRNIGRTPYTKWAGQSNIPDSIKDRFGNPQGSQYDLAEDGGFDGHGILIINLCLSSAAKLTCVKKALEKKGFDVDIHQGPMLSPKELKSRLSKVGQMWLISQEKTQMTDAHLEIIREFFNAGHGIYIWGDNDPLNGDANFIIQRMFDSYLSGDYYARKVLGIQKNKGEPGIIGNHLISTGIVSFYEGVTISKVRMSQCLTPLVYSSDGNIVTAFYEADEKRALIDGAFTRLWDSDWGTTAGTERYIVNAAAWLANVERFGY